MVREAHFRMIGSSGSQSQKVLRVTYCRNQKQVSSHFLYKSLANFICCFCVGFGDPWGAIMCLKFSLFSFHSCDSSCCSTISVTLGKLLMNTRENKHSLFLSSFFFLSFFWSDFPGRFCIRCKTELHHQALMMRGNQSKSRWCQYSASIIHSTKNI